MNTRIAPFHVSSGKALVLSPGSHRTADEGICAMEAAALLAGFSHTDRPRCTTEVIASYIRHLNDNAPDDVRARLIVYLPDIITIPEDDRDYLRNALFARHAVQVFAPAALRQAGYEAYARRLERQSRFVVARQIADDIVKKIGDDGPDMLPVQWAVYRAGEAANLADWFTSNKDDFFKGATSGTPYGACSNAAAATAFQAWRTGCEEIWDLALIALEEVLRIGR